MTVATQLTYERIYGREIAIGDVVQVWWSPAGARVLEIADYDGPLAHLFPEGARIIAFTSDTRSGVTGMNVPNDETYQRLVLPGKPESPKASRYIGGSLLPSSEPGILYPLTAPFGELQVKALPDLDTHALFLRNAAGEHLLAMHPNGYSCRALAERMVAGNIDPVCRQFEHILACGGLACHPGRFADYMSERVNHESPKA